MRWIMIRLLLALFGFGLLVTTASTQTVVVPGYEQPHDNSGRSRDRDYDRPRGDYRRHRDYDDSRRYRRTRNCAVVGGVKVCQ
jgi:hypothetical protein